MQHAQFLMTPRCWWNALAQAFLRADTRHNWRDRDEKTRGWRGHTCTCRWRAVPGVWPGRPTKERGWPWPSSWCRLHPPLRKEKHRVQISFYSLIQEGPFCEDRPRRRPIRARRDRRPPTMDWRSTCSSRRKSWSRNVSSGPRGPNTLPFATSPIYTWKTHLFTHNPHNSFLNKTAWQSTIHGKTNRLSYISTNSLRSFTHFQKCCKVIREIIKLPPFSLNFLLIQS